MLLANSGSHEGGTTGRFGRRERNVVPAIDQTFEIDGNRRSDLLEMSFEESAIAGLPNMVGNGLRNGTFEASPNGLAGFKGVRLLRGACGSKGLVLGLRTKR